MPLTVCPSFSHRNTHTFILSLFLSHTHTHKIFFYHPLHTHTYTHTHTHTHALNNTHTHTLTDIHTHTQTHTYKHSEKQMFSFSLYSLSNCSITEEGFSSLAPALRLNPSHIRELWLRGNEAGDSGVKHLSSLPEDPNCKLEKLELVSQDQILNCYQ